jgi:hypothetical protein
MADCPDISVFRARFPEFDPVADATVQMYLDDACGYLSPDAFGDCWERAVLYYAAHLLALAYNRCSSIEAATKPPASGAVSGSSAGGLSVSFASGSPKDTTEAWYQQTGYGQEFLVLASECVEITRIVAC